MYMMKFKKDIIDIKTNKVNIIKNIKGTLINNIVQNLEIILIYPILILLIILLIIILMILIIHIYRLKDKTRGELKRAHIKKKRKETMLFQRTLPLYTNQ